TTVEREAEDGVAGLDQCMHDRRVGLRAGMRLHVGELRVEQRLDTVDRQLLDDVDVLAAAVVAPARVALRIFIGQHGTLSLHDRDRRVVFRRDHLEAAALAFELLTDQLGDLGIEIAETFVQHTHADAPFDGGLGVLNTRLSVTDISECDRHHSWLSLRGSRVGPGVARPGNLISQLPLTVTWGTVQSVACRGFYCVIRNVYITARGLTGGRTAESVHRGRMAPVARRSAPRDPMSRGQPAGCDSGGGVQRGHSGCDRRGARSLRRGPMAAYPRTRTSGRAAPHRGPYRPRPQGLRPRGGVGHRQALRRGRV